MREHLEEWIFCFIRISEDEGALPKVIEQQTRENNPHPSGSNRFASKVAKIGIKRFRTCHGKEHSSNRGESGTRIVHDIFERIVWVNSRKNAEIVGNVQQAEKTD